MISSTARNEKRYYIDCWNKGQDSKEKEKKTETHSRLEITVGEDIRLFWTKVAGHTLRASSGQKLATLIKPEVDFRKPFRPKFTDETFGQIIV
jgi:hypothetical protein